MRQGGDRGGDLYSGRGKSYAFSWKKKPEKSLFKDTSVPARVYQQRAVTLAHTLAHTHTHIPGTSLPAFNPPCFCCCHSKDTFHHPCPNQTQLLFLERRTTRDAAGPTSGLLFFSFFFLPFPKAHVIFFYVLQSWGLFVFSKPRAPIPASAKNLTGNNPCAQK